MLSSAGGSRPSRRTLGILAGGALAASALFISVLNACAVSSAPGDYAQGTREGGAAVPRPPVPAGGARVLLLGGERDAVNGDDQVFIQETMEIIVRADGSVGDFFYDRAPPIRLPYAQAVLQNGTLLGLTSQAVVLAPIDTASGTISDNWAALQPADGGASPPGSTGLLLARPTLQVMAGGSITVDVDGGRETQYQDEVLTASLDLAGKNRGPFAVAQGKLTKARPQPRLAVYRDAFLYAVGGWDAAGKGAPVFDTVEVAPLRADGTLGDFAATESLKTAARPDLIINGSYLFAVGGIVEGVKLTNEVWYAHIKDDGALEPWQKAPSLPANLTLGALFVVNDKLYCAGGLTLEDNDAGAVSHAVDSILSLDLGPNGVAGDRWVPRGTLPAKRGGYAAVVMP